MVFTLRSTNFSDDAHINASGGVQDRFCFHPHQHIIVRALLPPDQGCGFLGGDLYLHVPIMSETAREIHEEYGFVS